MAQAWDSSGAPLAAIAAAICTALFGYLGAWLQLHYGERADMRTALEVKDAKIDAKLDAYAKALGEELRQERARSEEQGRALLEALREKNEEAALRQLYEIEMSRTERGREFIDRVYQTRENGSFTRRLAIKESQEGLGPPPPSSSLGAGSPFSPVQQAGASS